MLALSVGLLLTMLLRLDAEDRTRVASLVLLALGRQARQAAFTATFRSCDTRDSRL